MPRDLATEIEDELRIQLDDIMGPYERFVFHPLIVRFHPLMFLLNYFERRQEEPIPNPINNYGSIPR